MEGREGEVNRAARAEKNTMKISLYPRQHGERNRSERRWEQGEDERREYRVTRVEQEDHGGESSP